MRTEAGGCAGQDPGRPGGLGIPRSRSSGMGPGTGFRSQWGRFGPVRPSTGPREVSKVPERGAEASRWKTEKTPPSLSPGSLPPAAKKLPVTFPPNALPTQIHTNTPIPCTAASRGGGGGGSGLGEKTASFPFRPEVVLLRKSSHQRETRRPHGEGFQPRGSSQLQAGAGALLAEKWVGLSREARPAAGGEIP